MSILQPELSDFLENPSQETLGRLARRVGLEIADEDLLKMARLKSELASGRDQLLAESSARMALVALTGVCVGFSVEVDESRHREKVSAVAADPRSVRLWLELKDSALTCKQIAKILSLDLKQARLLVAQNLEAGFLESEASREYPEYRLALSGYTELEKSR